VLMPRDDEADYEHREDLLHPKDMIMVVAGSCAVLAGRILSPLVGITMRGC
jgi:hypothetical protein